MNVDLVDFHSHILPSVDHGSSSVETSCTQLELAKRYGVTRIFATSHFYPHMHTLSSFIEKRNKAYRELKENCNFSDVEIKLGAEVLVCENLDKLEGLSELCIYGTDHILLELPFVNISHTILAAVEKIILSGLSVILAHADRYPPEIIDLLLQKGAKIQLNADSLASFFKKKHIYAWIERGVVVGIGSDIHGKDEKAYKNFQKAKQKLGDAIADISDKSNEIWNKALLF